MNILYYFVDFLVHLLHQITAIRLRMKVTTFTIEDIFNDNNHVCTKSSQNEYLSLNFLSKKDKEML